MIPTNCHILLPSWAQLPDLKLSSSHISKYSNALDSVDFAVRCVKCFVTTNQYMMKLGIFCFAFLPWDYHLVQSNSCSHKCALKSTEQTIHSLNARKSIRNVQWGQCSRQHTNSMSAESQIHQYLISQHPFKYTPELRNHLCSHTPLQKNAGHTQT